MESAVSVSHSGGSLDAAPHAGVPTQSDSPIGESAPRLPDTVTTEWSVKQVPLLRVRVENSNDHRICREVLALVDTGCEHEVYFRGNGWRENVLTATGKELSVGGAAAVGQPASKWDEYRASLTTVPALVGLVHGQRMYEHPTDLGEVRGPLVEADDSEPPLIIGFPWIWRQGLTIEPREDKEVTAKLQREAATQDGLVVAAIGTLGTCQTRSLDVVVPGTRKTANGS